MRLTSARPSAGRFSVPAKMTSSIFWERTDLGRLRTQHPGDRVDDVRLAGTVRADDDGDARFERHDGRIGERLEALEGETLQEHGGPETTPRAGASPTISRTVTVDIWGSSGWSVAPTPSGGSSRRHRCGTVPRPGRTPCARPGTSRPHRRDRRTGRRRASSLRRRSRRSGCGGSRRASVAPRRATTRSRSDRAAAEPRAGSRPRRCCRCRRSTCWSSRSGFSSRRRATEQPPELPRPRARR